MFWYPEPCIDNTISVLVPNFCVNNTISVFVKFLFVQIPFLNTIQISPAKGSVKSCKASETLTTELEEYRYGRGEK